jgi:hypothetical protein
MKPDGRGKNLPQAFKKGNAGGPGRPPLIDPKLSDYKRNLTKAAVMSSLSEMLDCSEEDLDKILADKKVSALKKAMASVISACIKGGDYQRLEMLLNRTIGKVKDEAIIETKTHDEVLEKVPRDKIVELLRAANE